MPPLRVGEFFAGIGGFRLALEQYPEHFKVVFANDVDKYARQTYDANFSDPRLTLGDLRGMAGPDDAFAALPDMDMVVGGFPCQPFSKQGMQRGFADDRGQLFFTLAAVIKAKKPRLVLLENVRNLVSIDNGAVMSTIVRTLEDMGYSVKYAVLNTRTHSPIPQNRARVFITASLSPDFIRDFQFPAPLPPADLRPLASFFDADRQEDRFYYKADHRAGGHLNTLIVDKHHLHTMRTCTDVRPRNRAICPTLMASMGGAGNAVPVFRDDHGIRKLTPRECFRLQGFPDTYAFPPDMTIGHLYVQIGNAITVPVVAAILGQVVAGLEKERISA
jgi:DNA (cytosine-5)-methyltransferase 1